MSSTSDTQTSEATSSDPSALGWRERKKRATRAALQYAALELVATHGLENVTIDDITSRVEVSSRTFFNYFATKEEALVGADPDLLGHLTSALRARPAHEPPLIALRTVLIADADRVAAAKETWRLRMELATERPELFHTAASASEGLNTALAAVIAERAGTDLNVDPVPRLVAGVGSVARRTALHLWVHGNFASPYPQVMAECFDELTSLTSPGAKQSSKTHAQAAPAAETF